MPISDDVMTQLKAAMKARDKARVAGLRSIRAALLNEAKATGTDVSDAKAIEVLRRLAKQRKESIEAYDAGGRAELAAEERSELEVIEGFLPSLADEATTRAWVAEAIASSGAAGPRDMGRVMGALMKAHKGEIDGGLANRIARELLVG